MMTQQLQLYCDDRSPPRRGTAATSPRAPPFQVGSVSAPGKQVRERTPAGVTRAAWIRAAQAEEAPVGGPRSPRRPFTARTRRVPQRIGREELPDGDLVEHRSNRSASGGRHAQHTKQIGAALLRDSHVLPGGGRKFRFINYYFILNLFSFTSFEMNASGRRGRGAGREGRLWSTRTSSR